MGVLCLLMMQQKMPSCKEDAMALLGREAPLTIWSYKIKASVGIQGVCKTLSAISDTGAGPYLLKENCP